jgi:hypothetical protein
MDSNVYLFDFPKGFLQVLLQKWPVSVHPAQTMDSSEQSVMDATV